MTWPCCSLPSSAMEIDKWIDKCVTVCGEVCYLVLGETTRFHLTRMTLNTYSGFYSLIVLTKSDHIKEAISSANTCIHWHSTLPNRNSRLSRIGEKIYKPVRKCIPCKLISLGTEPLLRTANWLPVSFAISSVDEYDSASRHSPIPDLLPYLKILTALGCSYPGLSDARRAWQGVFNIKGIYRTCN